MGWLIRMFKTNKEREHYLVQSYSEMRKLYLLQKILIILLIIFTISLIILTKWSVKNQDEIKNKMFGSWDIVLLDVDMDEISFIKNHAFIEKYAIQSNIEKVFLEDNNRIVIGSSDENFFKLGNVELVQGRLPKYKSEVAVEQECLSILNIEKIGDIIPIDSPAKSLRGYKVCGIIKNYSKMWKSANWDVDYINCFIIKADKTKYTVYLEASNQLSSDIEINIHNYKKNIEIDNSKIFDEVINIYTIIFLTFLVIRIMIKVNLVKHQEFSRINEKNINKTNKKILLFFLQLISSYLVVIMINKIIFINNYFSDIRNNLMILLRNNETSFYLQLNELNDYVEIIDEYYNLYIKSIYQVDITSNFIALINIILMIFVVNYIIIYLSDLNKRESDIIKGKLAFYYGLQKSKKLKEISYYSNKIVLNDSFFLFLFFVKNFDLYSSQHFVFLCIFGLTINSVIVILESKFIKILEKREFKNLIS